MTAPLRPQPRPGVLDIAAYVPGKSSAPGVAKVFTPGTPTYDIVDWVTTTLRR